MRNNVMRPQRAGFRRAVSIGILCTGVVGAGVLIGARFPALDQMEQSFDRKLQSQLNQEPFDLLGNTRGVYIEGYGAVFSSELNLIYSPTISPFKTSMTKQEVDTIHKRKLDRLPVLRERMRQMLLDSSASLDDIPPAEQIVVGVKLWHYNWEDTHGLPNRITMQAQKQKLVEVQAGRTPRTALDSIIKVQEI